MKDYPFLFYRICFVLCNNTTFYAPKAHIKDRPALFSQNYPNNFTEDFLRKIRKKENCYH